MKKELKIGKVRQKFGNGELSKIYMIKNLPLQTGDPYWDHRVNVYNLDGTWNHVASIHVLENVDEKVQRLDVEESDTNNTSTSVQKPTITREELDKALAQEIWVANPFKGYRV